MSKKQRNKKENNKINEEKKMNIIEQHQAFYEEQFEKDRLLIIQTVREKRMEDIRMWREKFEKEMEDPSEEVQEINKEISINTTKKQRNEIICKVIKEKAEQNYKMLKDIEKQNPNCPVSVIRTNIDVCIIVNKEDGMPIFKGDIATAIHKLKKYIKDGITVQGTDMIYQDMDDEITPKEQMKILAKVEKGLRKSQNNWMKIEAVPEINKWIVIERRTNIVRFIASPEKMYKIII